MDAANSDCSRITIVIPTFNRREMLVECIDSLLRSSSIITAKDILVVDDSSTDGTAERVAGLGVRYQRTTAGEPGAARNAGLACVTSEFVLFIDDDDLAVDGHPDILVAALEARPECGLAFGQAVAFRGDEPPGAPFPAAGSLSGEGLRDAFFQPAQIGTVVFRTEALRAIGGFRNELRFQEDRDVEVRVAARWPTVFVPQVVERYRMHEHSVMGARDANRELRDLHQAYRQWRAAGVPWSWLLQLERNVRGRLSYQRCLRAQALGRAGDRRAALKQYAGALGVSPPHACLTPAGWKALRAVLIGA